MLIIVITRKTASQQANRGPISTRSFVGLAIMVSVYKVHNTAAMMSRKRRGITVVDEAVGRS